MRPLKRTCNIGYFFFAFLVVTASDGARAVERPNVLVILTDDQGWGDLSRHGNTAIRTPNIDSLAAEGAAFDRFFVCPVCSPTRAEFLTGRYHPRGGVRGVSRGGERLNLDETTIADVFQSAGYATGMFGKWHNGTQSQYHPIRRGFSEFYGFTSGHWGSYFDAMLDHQGEIVTSEGYLSDDLTEKAIGFMRRSVAQSEPFFTYVAYNTPHSPMQVPDRWFDAIEGRELLHDDRGKEREKLTHTKAALAMVENLDWNIERMLSCLDDVGVAENTIVAFFCDNGPNGSRFNGDMRGIKGSTDEGGVRSPMFIRWPAKISPGINVAKIAGAIDLFPTLIELAKVADIAPGDRAKKPLDGRSLASLLVDDNESRAKASSDWSDRQLFSHWGGRVSVRTQRYRLDHGRRLYDMQTDPGQRVNIASTQKEVASRLEKSVKAWRSEMFPEGWEQDDRRYLIDGNPSLATHLPARDADATGQIKRSSRHPNCSYFSNWKDVRDYIEWPVEVGQTGDYAFEILYACDDAAVGSEYFVEWLLDSGKKSKSPNFTVKVANPALERGEEHDRHPRTESYVKSWKKLKGSLRLEAGVGKLRIRAETAPKKQLVDFRMLLLRRIAL